MSDMIPKLREMAESPHYALRRGVLLVAAQHIEELQTKLAKANEEIKRLRDLYCEHKLCFDCGKPKNEPMFICDKGKPLSRLKAKNKRLREALEAAQQLMEWAESKCHVNCADGYVPMMPHGDPEPCQWCITKTLAEQALKEVEPDKESD